MNRNVFLAVSALSIAAMAVRAAFATEPTESNDRGPVVLTERAKEFHATCLVFDGHNDLPWQFRKRGTPTFDQLDIGKPQPDLQTDIPRLRIGGVSAQFWSVYVPVSTSEEGKALLTTLEQIELVHRMVARYPETFAFARNADDVERIHAEGKIASLIGVEGGHSIENSLGTLRQLYRRGARYMTLTHSANLDWADSATDDAVLEGLSPFGEAVVEEMNRLGMLVDISHVSHATMKHAIRVSKAPVIFSHSSARSIADHPRNVPDDVLKMTATNGGVVMVNFYSSFVVPASAKRSVEHSAYKNQLEKEIDDPTERDALLKRWELARPIDRGDIHTVVDHIDHIVEVAGIDHVGLGSDFDGIDTVPKQLEDVSCYPYITQELLNRGYTHDAIRKILGTNALRVLRQAGHVAQELSNKPSQ